MAVSVHVAVPKLDGRGRRVGHIAVHRAIAVVHRANEDALASLFVAAPSASSALLLAIPVVLEEPVLAGGLRLRLGLLLKRRRLLVLGLVLTLAIGLGATLVALAAAAAAMPDLSLALPLVGCLRLRRDRVFRRRLRLVLLCCHACTSWCDGLCS